MYTRFLDPEARKEFFAAFKELENLWEILSPSAELRDHIDAFKRLTLLYAAVRNAYSDRPGFVSDLARKTQQLVQGAAASDGLGFLTKTITFDVRTVKALLDEAGPVEAKVFNLVRGLRQEVEADSAMAPLLRPLRDRAEIILKGMEERTTAGLAAMDMLAALAGEKEAAAAAAGDSDLAPRAFAVYWALRGETSLGASGVNALDLAREADSLLARFPNAPVNPDERKRLRAALYRPLLALEGDERARIVERTASLLLDGGDSGDE